MAKTLNKGFDSTGEVMDKTLAIAGFKYPDEFRVKSESPDEAILVNVTSPMDRLEKLRFAYSEVADVYKNTSIDSSVAAASKRGVQILAQASETWSLTDAADPEYRVDLPVTAHIVVKVPACEYISETDILELLGRTVGGLYDGTTAQWRLSDLVRGALVPKGL